MAHWLGHKLGTAWLTARSWLDPGSQLDPDLIFQLRTAKLELSIELSIHTMMFLSYINNRKHIGMLIHSVYSHCSHTSFCIGVRDGGIHVDSQAKESWWLGCAVAAGLM